MNERELLFGVLTGEAKGELSKTGLSKFMQQNNEYKNLAFYDAVLEFAYKWEYWYEKLHQGEVVPYDSVLIFQSQRRRQQSHSKSSQQNSKNSTGMVSKEFFNDANAKKQFKLYTVQLEQEKVKEENAFDIPSHHLLSNDIFEKFCKRTCREIANQFLVHDYSPDELNIEEKTKRNVMDAVFAKNEYNPMVFRRALAEVILEIHRNGFQKYRQNGGGNGGSIAPKSLAQKGLTVMNVVDNKPPTIVGPAPPRRHREASSCCGH